MHQDDCGGSCDDGSAVNLSGMRQDGVQRPLGDGVVTGRATKQRDSSPEGSGLSPGEACFLARRPAGRREGRAPFRRPLLR